MSTMTMRPTMATRNGTTTQSSMFGNATSTVKPFTAQVTTTRSNINNSTAPRNNTTNVNRTMTSGNGSVLNDKDPNDVEVTFVYVMRSASPMVRKATFDAKEGFDFYWEQSPGTNSVQLELIKKIPKNNSDEMYLAMGFSPSGTMAGADIVVCGMYKNGTVYFQVSLL